MFSYSTVNNLSARHDQVRSEVHIALVGKYVQMEDAYLSVIKALTHAALHCNLKLVLQVGRVTTY